jgi:hypothetical protein
MMAMEEGIKQRSWRSIADALVLLEGLLSSEAMKEPLPGE